MTSPASGRRPRVISDPNLWIVIAMFAVGVIFHYPQQILALGLPSLFTPLGLTRHAMERVLFLLPINYAGFVFGIKAGLASLLVALIVMLPRVLWLSDFRADSVFEITTVVLVGGLVNLWFEGYRKEKERGQQLLQKLEAAQQELKSHLELIRSNEKRLAILNEVSAIVNRSLDLETVLKAATDKVVDVMFVDAAMMFLLDEERQELVLGAYRGVSGELVAALRGLKVGEGFNGLVAQTGAPLVVEDISSDARLTRQEVEREGLRGEVIVALKAKGKVLGTLCAATRRSRRFLPEEVELLAHIANNIGVALENARLYQREHQMAEQIARDVAREKQMRESMRFYLQQVTRAQEEERKRIARELHDDTIQELVALSRRLDGVISSAGHLSRQDAATLDGLREQTDRILDGVRRFSQDLRPSVLDDLGLLPALEWLTANVSQAFHITIDMRVAGTVRRFTPEVELVLFRIAQEALRNVGKHSRASRASVALEFGEENATLTVSDNGKGFELPGDVDGLTTVGKLGLAGMSERAQLLGGSLKIDSAPGKGATVRVEIPSPLPG